MATLDFSRSTYVSDHVAVELHALGFLPSGYECDMPTGQTHIIIPENTSITHHRNRDVEVSVGGKKRYYHHADTGLSDYFD